ncbi:AAA domain-containing protein [Virgisporangium aurantiacum]|uniref:Very short patch repair endonuclease n=1 Tax=Virgisporangium aurantiacum TaxID=175570 RepID=A0A8J3Z481_9ACTN|nr:AAA domain-containing protein [Virgisporangium aurantiacum]GIJ56092.1 very short patch repair endonuclease [Virgisporangium aurantiacum]
MAETPLVIRDRAVALTDYLLAVRAQVERPVRTVSTADAFWQNGFPRHPELAVGPSSGSDAWLRVGLPVAEKPIVVPVQFRNLVLSGVTHDREPRLLPEVDSDVLAAFEAWRDREWRPWARRAAETEAVRSLHLRLFDLKYRLDMNAATEELVWGHGIGELRVDGARVSYPLFATPVAIEYDPDGPTVFVSPQGFTRLQTDPITGIDERRLRQLVEFCGAGGQVTTDLWDDVERRELFEGVLRRLGVDPVIREASSPAPTGQHIHDTGVLFARPRQRMLRRFLQKLRDRLLAGDLDSIGSLAAILAHEPSALRMPGDRPDTWAPVGERLLMPLSTNEAQESIAYRLAGSRTVAVQGPPGTGKTHTIRNLICHLMAHGKRVLVLAQKNDPLTVLRDGLPADIQPLCIAVLGRSTDQLIQLQLAARELSDRAATMDHRAGQAEVDRLSQGLQDAERDLARALNNLRNIAEKESACYDIDGATLSISEVGTWLRERQGDLAEIPDAINRSAPLSVAEFTVLLKLANRVPAADRVQALHVLPTTDDLPSASELTSRRRRRHAATTEADRLSAAGVDLNKIRGLGQVALRALVGDLRDAQRVLGGREGGWTGRLGDLLADRHWQQLWDDHAAACDRAMQELAAVARALAGHDVRVSPELAAEQRRLSGMLTELRERFTAGKGVSKVFQSALARVAAGCLVDGEPLRSAADVDLILAFLRRYQLRQELGRRWAEWAPRVGLTLPEPLGEPELWAGRLFSDAATALDWDRRRWPALCQVLRPLGVPTPTPVSAANLGVVQDILTRADVVFELDALVDAEQQITDLLRSGQSGPDASPLWRVLDLSWQDADLPRWDALCAEATRLAALRADADTYRSLHGRLAAVAPGWAAEIDAGTARVLSGLGADCERRWEWRRAQTWFDQTIAGADPAELGRRVDRARERIRRLTGELVSAAAWLQVARSLDDRRRAALADWTTALRKIGKGTGRSAAHWQQHAQRAMTAAVDAVPVWVMSIDRAIEQFTEGARFDVVIVDEASQADMFALPVLSLADRAVVVGDDQQIGPQLPFLGDVSGLIAAHLNDLPSAEHFDAEGSLYDHAVRRSQRILLTEHFRCVPAIIDFSSHAYYDGKIQPLRADKPAGVDTPVVAVHVGEGVRQHVPPFGEVNVAEADALVERVGLIVDDPAHAARSIGVVSLLSSSGQAMYMLDRIRDRIGAEEMHRRRLRVGDPYTFQGDERDIVLLSMVVSANDPRRPGAFTKRDYHRRINVAASRARDQLWLYHSIQTADLVADDARAKLIEYCQNVTVAEETYSDLERRCDSDFERDVLRRILARGYRPLPQFAIGRYRIDFMLPAPDGRRLAIECDGDAYHGPDQWESDMRRQAMLERVGNCVFVRIRGSAFSRDPEAALAPLWTRIDELRIGTYVEPVLAVPEPARPRQAPRVRNTGWPRVAADVDWDSVSEADQRALLAAAADGREIKFTSRGVWHVVEDEPVVVEPVVAEAVVAEPHAVPVRPAPEEPVVEEPVPEASATEPVVEPQTATTDDGLPSVPAGYRSAGWVRPHEALAALDAYEALKDTPIRHEGKITGWARYRDSASEEAKRYRANVVIERAGPRGARIVCWLRQPEARALVRAAQLRRDIPVADRSGTLAGLVQYFPAASPYALRGRSVTRLLRCTAGRSAPAQRAETPAPDVIAQFNRAMTRVYERARDEAGYNATVFRRMLAEHGGLGTARQLLRAGHVSEGFTALWERDRIDLTVEALVLDSRYGSLFTEDELAVARDRIDHARRNPLSRGTPLRS